MFKPLLTGWAFWISLAGVIAAEPKPLQVIRATADITWVAFTPDSKQLLVSGDATYGVGDEMNYQVSLWTVATGKLAAGPVKGAGIGASGTVSPDGRLALTGGTAGEWRLWTLPKLEAAGKGTTEGARVDRVAFRPDGKAFTALTRLSGSKGKVAYTAYTFETEKHAAVGKLIYWPSERPQTGRPAEWTLGFDPAFTKEGGPVPPDKKSIALLEVPEDGVGCGGPMAVAISRNGQRAVSSGCNGEVVLWDYPKRKVEGKPLVEFKGMARVMDPGLAISADGGRVAIASMAENSNTGHILSLNVYDWATRKVILGPVEFGATGVGLVEALAFSPDGTLLAIAFGRRGMQIKDPQNEIQIWQLPAKK